MKRFTLNYHLPYQLLHIKMFTPNFTPQYHTILTQKKVEKLNQQQTLITIINASVIFDVAVKTHLLGLFPPVSARTFCSRVSCVLQAAHIR